MDMSKMPSTSPIGAILQGDREIVIGPLQTMRREEGWLRGDGDPNLVKNPEGTFGQRYIDEERIRQEIVDSHPDIQFVNMVAGLTNATLQEFYEESSVSALVRERVRKAQEFDTRRRLAPEFTRELRASIKEHADDIEKSRVKLDDLEIQLRDVKSAFERYEAGVKVAEDEHARLEGILKAGDDVTLEKLSVIASSLYGEYGFKSDRFRGHIKKVVERSILNIAASRKTGSPRRVIMALYMAALYVAVKNQSYMTVVLDKAPEFSVPESEYATDPDLLGGDLKELWKALVTAPVRTDRDAKIADFGKISIALWQVSKVIKERGMLSVDAIGVPRVETSRTAANVGGVPVSVEDGQDIPFSGILTNDQEKELYTRLYTSTSSQVDTEGFFLVFLKPVFDSIFPYLIHNIGAPDGYGIRFGGGFPASDVSILDLVGRAKLYYFSRKKDSTAPEKKRFDGFQDALNSDMSKALTDGRARYPGNVRETIFDELALANQALVFVIFQNVVGFTDSGASLLLKQDVDTIGNFLIDKSTSSPQNIRNILTRSKGKVEDLHAKAVASLNEKFQEEAARNRDLRKNTENLRVRLLAAETESAADIEKRERSQTTVDPSDALSTINTGIVRLSPIFTSAVVQAHQRVKMHVPALCDVTIEYLQNAQNGLLPQFAALVANMIFLARIRHPSVYTNQNAPILQQTDFRNIIASMRSETNDTGRRTWGLKRGRGGFFN